MNPGSRFNGWVKRWLPALIVMAMIFLASSIPSDKMPKVGEFDFEAKKAGHMLGYALLWLSLVHGVNKPVGKSYWLAAVGCLLYALTDEYHQSFVPGRNATLFDVGIDMIGVLISSILYSRFALVKRITLSNK